MKKTPANKILARQVALIIIHMIDYAPMDVETLGGGGYSEYIDQLALEILRDKELPIIDDLVALAFEPFLPERVTPEMRKKHRHLIVWLNSMFG